MKSEAELKIWKEIHPAIVDKLLGWSVDEDLEEDDGSDYHLFKRDDSPAILKMRPKIQRTINKILEKTLFDAFSEGFSGTNKILEAKISKPYPQLNDYILNLKTEVEKKIALLLISDANVNALSKSHQELRKEYYLRLLNDTDSMKYWSGNYNANFEEPEVQAEIAPQANVEEESQQQSQPLEEPEGLEIKVEEKELIAEEEKFDGLIDKNQIKITMEPDFDAQFFIRDEKRKGITDTLKKKIFENVVEFYVTGYENRTKVRQALHVATHNFLESFIVGYFLESKPKESTTLFSNIAINPLNEIRLVEVILIIQAIDPANEEALKAFNEYFGTKLDRQQFEEKLKLFNGRFFDIFDGFLTRSIKGRNAFEVENYDEIVAEAERLVGVLPLKQKMQPFLPQKLSQSALNYISSTILDSSLSDKDTITVAVKVLKGSRLGNLTPSVAYPKEISLKIHETTDLIKYLDRNSSIRRNLCATLSNYLENYEVFFDFLDSMPEPLIESSNLELNHVLAELKKILNSANPEIKDIEELLTNKVLGSKMLSKIEVVLFLVSKECENILQNIKEHKESLPNEEEDDLAGLILILSELLENKNLKHLYATLIHIFELLENSRKEKQALASFTPHLEMPLDIILNINRIFHLHASIIDHVERAKLLRQDGNQSLPTLSSDSSLGKLRRIVSKAHDEEDSLILPGLERSMTQIKESQTIKYDELMVRLIHKAKSLVQQIKTSTLPENSRKMEINLHLEADLFTQFPWVLTFEKKKKILDSFLEKEKGPNFDDRQYYDQGIFIRN